jgi:hypothetical protein
MLAISGCPRSCSPRSSPRPIPPLPTTGPSVTPPAAQPDASEPYANIAAEVRHEFADSTDAMEAAAKAGEPDYLSLVAGAMARDRQAMHRLLRLTARPEFAGPALTDHSEVLAAVLPDVGDRFFASCLAAEPPALQRQVRQAIVANFSHEDKSNLNQQQKDLRALEDLRGTFPKSFPLDSGP